jgi:phosphodiesterase/alkaline phosphatase D-like protein
MTTSRRDFLKQSGVVSAGLLTIPSFSSAQNFFTTLAANSFGEFPIHQGLTLENLTYLTVLRKVTAEISFEVVDSKNKITPFIMISVNRMTGSDYQLDKLKVPGMKLGELYRFRVLNAKKQIIDERFFKALDTKKKMPKIAIASCMHDFFKSASKVMWEKLHSHNPDLTFLIGDTCYADQKSDGTALGFWNRYVDTRNQIGIFRHQNLTPILASWDDHDFGQNNGDGSFGEKKFMLDLFSAFWLWPEEENYRREMGVFQEFSAFGQKFYMMDCRYFRSKETHYGDQQEDMLYDSLDKHDQPSWLMNGSQFFGGYAKGEAYENTHNASFKVFCQQLSRVKAPVCFVSGDVHFSELMEIEREVLGYQTFELTSSSIHSFTYLQHHNMKKNPRRIKKCGTSKHNFHVVTIDNTADKFKFNVACQGDEKEIYFERSLEITR